MLRACRQPTFPDLLLTGGKCALPPDVGVGFFRWRPTKVSNFAQLPLGSARNNESGGDGAAPPLSQVGGVRFSKGSEPPKDQQRAPLCRLQFGRKICHDHNLPLAFSSACRPPLGIAAETPKVSAGPCANRRSDGRCECGRRATAPSMSIHVRLGLVEHHWTCSGCGRQWSTSTVVPVGSVAFDLAE